MDTYRAEGRRQRFIKGFTMSKSFRPERFIFENVRSQRARRGLPARGHRGATGVFSLGATGIVSAMLLFFGVSGAGAATIPVNLGVASTYAILAGSTITNTGSSVIAGDIGLSPGTSVTGFPPGVQSSGVMNVNDAAALSAKTALTNGYLDAQGRTPATTTVSDLGGSTLVPGIYRAPSSLGITGTLTLNGGGDSNAVFIFQVPTALTTASGSSVVLENGASACNVFWQVTSSATLGSSSTFAGTIEAQTSITLDTGAAVSGRVLASTGAVTLDSNRVSVPVCGNATTTTTTVPVTTTTVPVTTTTTAPVTTTTVHVTTTTVPTTTTTVPIIPVGAPQTGFGGTASGGPSPRDLLGAGGVALMLGATAMALRARRRRTMTVDGSSSNDQRES